MPRLIIGHVSDTEARIWVRAGERFPFAFIRCEAAGLPAVEKMIQLEARHNFTGVFELTGLAPDTTYAFRVRCGSSASGTPGRSRRYTPNAGAFRTAPSPGTVVGFTFLLASCNLHSLGGICSPDPAFERIGKFIGENNAAFMLHVGDQIYYDVPVLFKLPDLDEYRDKYHDAWGESAPTQAVLARIPHYMILDDHEISNDFHNDMELDSGTIDFKKEVALKAYREYQHIHNPQTFGSAPLYYTFERAHAGFFVLDARSERYQKPPGNQMIGEEQLARFFGWLSSSPARVKFVATCVPFVGEARNTMDKWADRPYRPQRDRIVDFIAEKQIQNVIFLTGDMHNSYCARMDIRRPGVGSIALHELMSSPVNHFDKAGPQDYLEPVESTTAVGGNQYKAGIVPGTFFHEHSNFMAITVGADEVSWEVYRARKGSRPEKAGRIPLA